MKKTILNLGKTLNKTEQKSVNGGSAHAPCTGELKVGDPCNQGSGVCIIPFRGATYLECSTYNPFLDM